MRADERAANALRPLNFDLQVNPYAEGSVLVSLGSTKVLCTASVAEGVPRFLLNSDQGWLTAEYGMLPRATHERCSREAARGKQGGRTLEIQRLIGRSCRAAVDLTLLGPYTITLDCDVLQADGGTRTAAINGACLALHEAFESMLQQGLIKKSPLRHFFGAISVGIVGGEPMLDLAYNEDSTAHTDMNVVMTESGDFIELQGTAEQVAFNRSELNDLLALAEAGIAEIITQQKSLVGAGS